LGLEDLVKLVKFLIFCNSTGMEMISIAVDPRGIEGLSLGFIGISNTTFVNIAYFSGFITRIMCPCRPLPLELEMEAALAVSSSCNKLRLL